MYRMLVGHSSEVYTGALARQLETVCQLRLCHDGPSVMAAMGRFQPDILLLDAAIIRKDALSILRQSAFVPRVVVVSINYTDKRILQQLQTLGVRQVLLMPTANTVDQYIRTLIEKLQTGTAPCSLEHLTAMQLHALQFQPHLDGYRQLCIGIPLLCRDIKQPLIKTLYPAIAEALDLPDWRAVEHSIRKSICQAWEQRDNDAWKAVFPSAEQSGAACPSNKQFLLRMAEHISRRSRD